MVAEQWDAEDPDALVLAQCATVLDRLYERIAHRFGRVEVRARVRRYVMGLLERLDRKNGWQVAEAIGEAEPQGIQRLLTTAVWDAEAVRDDLRRYVVEQLGDRASGVLIVDESGFLKKGAHSYGVAAQYCGTVGRSANCQVGVFLGYTSVKGVAFLDRALYLPRVWAEDRERRAAAGVPDDVRFATKITLAQRLLEGQTSRLSQEISMAMVGTEQIDVEVPGDAERTQRRGLWWDAWRRLRQNKAATTGAVVIVLMLLLAAFAPLLAPDDPNYIPATARSNTPPFWMAGHDPRYPLGTDSLARDELSRLLI